jgi:VCBS repeat-containing protein
LGDPHGDHQTGQGEADIVGNSGTLTTSLSSFYFKHVAGTNATNGTMHYRVRVGGDQSPAGFKSALLIGADANRDGKLDLFVGIDNSGQSNGVYIWRPGNDLNISPSTTSLESRTPVKRYALTGSNYHWGAVDSISSTAGVVLDPSADTQARRDFNGAAGTDYLLSFSLPFADIVAALGAQGIAINSSTPVTYVMGTSTQVQSFNQDLNGVAGGTSSNLTWGALGVLTQPVSPSGVVTNVAPVNTVPTARTANGTLALTGVSVNDVDGNLATVRITSTQGTVSVSLPAGVLPVSGANGTSTITIGGTQSQINAMLGTLGFTPSTGFTGAASVTILSTDSGGLTDTDTTAITIVSQPNTAPVANGDSATTHSGKSVAVNALANDVDADGNILTITSTTLASGTGTMSALNGIITFTPATNFVGTAVINYTISDGFGGTSNGTLTITVTANTVPIAVNDVINANPQSTIYIPVLANDSDADGDVLTISSVSRTSGQGSASITGREILFTAPNSNGVTVLSYTISDGSGGAATASVTITTAANTAPVAVNDAASTSTGTTVDINVLANDSDANGDALIISDVVVTSGSGTALAVNGRVRFIPDANFQGTATVTYTIDDGRGGTATAVVTISVIANSAPVAAADSHSVAEDGVLIINGKGVLTNDSDAEGNTLTAQLVANPTHGALTLNSDGSFTYTPNANFSGSDSFTYRASDGALTSNAVAVSITVTPVNDAPVAAGEAYTLAEDTVLSVSSPGILANDTDVESTPLAAVLVESVSYGTLTLNPNGSFVYSPNANYAGTDAFTYRVSDGALSSGIVTVLLTVTGSNDAPVAAADPFTVLEDEVLSVPAPGVLANDTDVDSATLSAALVNTVANGTLAFNSNGSFTYTPAPNFAGTDSFTYAVTDGGAISQTVTATIVVKAVNDAPVARADAYFASHGSTLVVSTGGLLDNDSDVEGDVLSAVLVESPSSGTLSLNADGTFTFQPASGISGPVTFTYRASDGLAISKVMTVTITVENGAPTAMNDAYTVVAGDTLAVLAPGLLANDSDPEGAALTASIVTTTENGTLVLNGDGSFTYAASASFAGTDSFSYRVSDGMQESATATVSISVTAPSTNRPPVLSVQANLTTPVTTPIAFTVKASDPDGDDVSVTIAAPAKGTISGDGSEYIYTPDSTFVGTVSFVVTAKDGRGATVSRTVRVTTTAAQDGVGNYAMLLRDEAGEVGGHVMLTCTPLGRATGILSLGGQRYNVRGFFAGNETTIVPRVKGGTPISVTLKTDRSVEGSVAIAVQATDGERWYSARAERCPYGKARPAPQTGKYTFVASRQPIVLARTGYIPQQGEEHAAPLASAMTMRVLPTGAVTFAGSSGTGSKLVCSSYIMPGGELPFYAGRMDPGGNVQWSSLQIPEVKRECSSAISGVLQWSVNRDVRVPVAFSAEYPVLGARYTPPKVGQDLLGTEMLTLSLNVPSFAEAGLALPYEDTRAFVGNLMLPTTGNVAAIRYAFSSGAFITRVQGRVTRPIFGVIIQGENVSRGLGSVVDFRALGSCELLPCPAKEEVLQSL